MTKQRQTKVFTDACRREAVRLAHQPGWQAIAASRPRVLRHSDFHQDFVPSQEGQCPGRVVAGQLRGGDGLPVVLFELGKEFVGFLLGLFFASEP